MQGEPNKKDQEMFKTWASDLACPVCHGALRIDEADVVCAACGRVYPVVDGIPVLIVERAGQES
jgi:uncharacterized protein YbaR (Trm112 family)